MSDNGHCEVSGKISHTDPFRRFSIQMCENVCTNNVRCAMICGVYFSSFSKITFLKGLCAYTLYF